MADQRTMAELLRALTEGYAEAILVPPILADQFELKHTLINTMTSDQFFGLEKDNPHDHIRWFNKITSTIKYKDVPNSAIKLMLFPYKDLLRDCPHHGFTELHQLDTFYNALNPADQDSLNAAAGDNLLERHTKDVLTIIENKSKVRNSRNKLVVSQVKSCDANSNSSSEIAKLTHAVNQQMSAVTTVMTAILKQFQATPPPAFVKVVEEICVTCGGSGSLPSNTVANPKGELKAITTRSGIVLDGPTVPTHPPLINPKVDERVDETLTDPDLSEYTIKVPPPPKMLKALLSNKEKLQELVNTPLNENWLAVILKKLPKKLGDPGKFLILCGFSELKCKALADLGASINLIPLSVWKKLGLPELISTLMTHELANRAICTPTGIARDVFVLVGKFRFSADFVIVDYESTDLAKITKKWSKPDKNEHEIVKNAQKPDPKTFFSDPRVPLILGRPFLRTARALIDVHGEEMILRDGDERLTLNMRHDTSSYSNQPQKESINLINVFNNSSEDFLEDLFSTNQPSGNPTFSSHLELTSQEVKDNIFDSEGGNVLPEKLLDLDSTKDLHPPLHFDVESDLKEIEFLLHRDIDSSLKDSIDQSNIANPADNFVDYMPEMFTDEHAPDYLFPSIFDEYDDDLFEVESDTENVFDDPFDSKGEKIKESKLLNDELDLHCDFLPSFEYDSFPSEDFSRVDALPLTNDEDKIFNLCVLSQENPFEIITRVVQDKKLATSNASLVLEDFDPPLYELPFLKKVPRSNMLLLFSSKNEEKVFKPEIHTSKKVHSSYIPERSH
nr:hypothetical protein [Tanacetum cinerariifolium]